MLVDGLGEQSERGQRGKEQNEMYRNFVWSVVKLIILTARGQYSASLSKSVIRILTNDSRTRENVELMENAGKSVCSLMASAGKSSRDWRFCF